MIWLICNYKKVKPKRLNLHNEITEPDGLKGRFTQLSQTLQAYLSAFNEVAIVSVTDLKGNILYVNDKFVEVSQYSKGELFGKNHRIIKSNFHSKEFFNEMWATIASGKPWRAEIKNKAKDGSFYWVDTVIIPVKDKNGQPFQYLSIRNLVTAQKENEETLVAYQTDLLKQKKQLKEAQSVAKTGSWFVDIPGNKLEWSEETYRIFEIPEDTPMTYELFLQYVHPDDKAIVDKNWGKAMQTGFYEVEHRIKTASGEKWVRERARFDFNSSTALNSVLGTVQDITDKKKTEQAVEEAARQYRELFNHSPFALGIADKKTLRFLKVNETAVKLYGYSEEEFMQLSIPDLRLPEEKEILLTAIEQGKYASDKSARKHVKKNGDILLAEPTISEIIYDGKEAFLISIDDVTEKVKIEQELAKEKYYKQREIDRAALEAEEKSRNEIGMELHDNINQLLVASTLYIKGINTASEEDRLQLQQGTNIINNAIEEIRKLSSRFVAPSLKNLTLTEAIEFLTQSIKLSGCKVKLQSNMLEQEFDESFKVNLYRIIQELFSNIIKYAGATEINVNLVQENKTLLLEVADNGKGFHVEQKAKGIGLANIRHRANLFEGKCNIISSPGNGCSVAIKFVLS